MLYDIIVYIFSDFWRWIGALIMMIVVCGSLSGLFKVTINRGKKDIWIDPVKGK